MGDKIFNVISVHYGNLETSEPWVSAEDYLLRSEDVKKQADISGEVTIMDVVNYCLGQISRSTNSYRRGGGEFVILDENGKLLYNNGRREKIYVMLSLNGLLLDDDDDLGKSTRQFFSSFFDNKYQGKDKAIPSITEHIDEIFSSDERELKLDILNGYATFLTEEFRNAFRIGKNQCRVVNVNKGNTDIGDGHLLLGFDLPAPFYAYGRDIVKLCEGIKNSCHIISIGDGPILIQEYYLGIDFSADCIFRYQDNEDLEGIFTRNGYSWLIEEYCTENNQILSERYIREEIENRKELHSKEFDDIYLGFVLSSD